jgi:hypothetical protein
VNYRCWYVFCRPPVQVGGTRQNPPYDRFFTQTGQGGRAFPPVPGPPATVNHPGIPVFSTATRPGPGSPAASSLGPRPRRRYRMRPRLGVEISVRTRRRPQPYRWLTVTRYHHRGERCPAHLTAGSDRRTSVFCSVSGYSKERRCCLVYRWPDAGFFPLEFL